MLRFVLVVFPFTCKIQGTRHFCPKPACYGAGPHEVLCFLHKSWDGAYPSSHLVPPAQLWEGLCSPPRLSPISSSFPGFPFPPSLLISWLATKPGSSSKLQHAKCRSGPGWGSFTAAGTFSSVPSAFTFTLLLRYRGRGFCSLHIFPTSYPALFAVHDFRVSKVSVSSLQAWRAPGAVYPGALLQAVSSALSPTFCSTTSFSAGFWSAAVLLYRRRHSFVHTSRITHSSELACVVAGYLQETLSFCHAQCCFSLKRRI